MKRIDIITYIQAKKDFWSPKSWLGYLFCTLAFLFLLSVFILVFCLPENIEVEEPVEDHIAEPLPVPETPVPRTGDVQILLKWYNTNDLDIICVDPRKDTLNYKNLTSRSGGILDFDMNRNKPYSQTPMENIFWPSGKAPNGTYSVYLKHWDIHDSTATQSNYDITVKYNGHIREFRGVIKPRNTIHICSFVVE